jgi:hypothetical protein
MRIEDSVRDTVVFLGYPTDDPAKGGIDCIGTGFLLLYDGFPYLVTVRHVAEVLGNDPFMIRVNRYDGGSDNIPVDNVKWYYDSDPTIDIAVIPFDLPNRKEHYGRYIDDKKETWWWNKARKYGAGIGDFCYTVGLFRLLAGSKRNMPIVHFGTIARTMSSWENETIPIKDWRDPDGKKTIQTNAYLIESQSLAGLSGSPVFIRASNLMVRPDDIAANPGSSPEDIGDAVAMWRLHLLGVWQGAWDAPPDEVLGAEIGKEVRVPVGIGVVIPADHIHYALEGDELKAMRNRLREERQATSAASLDVASVVRSNRDEPADDANPHHLEDFKRLVDVAARKRPQGDQT